jgi:hypothetical protein
MKMSRETVGILKYLSSISLNLMLKPGGELATINAQKNVIADVKVKDEFPIEFGIYDLNQFLGVVNLFSDPDITFNDKYAVIKEGGSSVKFFAADPTVLQLPTRKIVFPTPDIEFVLEAAQLAAIQKTASVLGAPDVSIVGANGVLSINVGDLKTPASNSYVIELGEATSDFSANIRVQNLHLMPMDYNVAISSKKISRFVSTDESINVKIALESTSSF